MSKEEMFKTSGNFIGLQALLRIMIDLIQMSLCELYVIFFLVFKQDKRFTVHVKYFLNLVTIRYIKQFSDSTTARETLYGLLYKGLPPGGGGVVTLRSLPSVFFVVRFFLILDALWLVKGHFLH